LWFRGHTCHAAAPEVVTRNPRFKGRRAISPLPSLKLRRADVGPDDERTSEKRRPSSARPSNGSPFASLLIGTLVRLWDPRHQVDAGMRIVVGRHPAPTVRKSLANVEVPFGKFLEIEPERRPSGKLPTGLPPLRRRDAGQRDEEYHHKGTSRIERIWNGV
jgi:hypothetical protein